MSLRLLTAGESHEAELALIVDGLPAGLRVDITEIDHQLKRRQSGYGRGARSTKIEEDHAQIISGVVKSRTTGAPVALRIINRDFANQPQAPARLTTPRPGHADLAGAIKHRLGDFRLVRERASARETTARVAAFALTLPLLQEFGIHLGCFVTQIGQVTLPIDLGVLDAKSLAALAAHAELDPNRCPAPTFSKQMIEAIDQAQAGRQTLGGSFVAFATGAPVGLGSYTQWDLRLDGRLAQAICSIPAIKAVEIGPAREVAALLGSQAQDPIHLSKGKLTRSSNYAGGVEGGMSNGEPIVLRATMKPLSSTREPVQSIDLIIKAPANPPYIRSDICSVPAAAVIGESMLGWVLAQTLLERFGGDRLDAMLAAASQVNSLPLPGLSS